ncbi:MAG: hypothetical protein CMD88_04595 [Gammaproteobacteria bacterium]|nr:hypothetical protein [Gammaproteobacteria bacterium]|tara:strand:+ start:41029 stop:41370 length:342 start_codon:yes stop_codon:yes gene_type:complete
MGLDDNKIFSNLIDKFSKNKEKIRSTLLQIKTILAEESKESSEMLSTYQKYVSGQKIEKDEIDKANIQFSNLIKNIGALGIFALPGGILAIAFLVKLGNKFGINILPDKYFKD